MVNDFFEQSVVKNIAVLGAGAWGTAIAKVLVENHHQVTLWTHSALHLHTMQATKRNQRYLPQVVLPDDLAFTSDLHAAVSGNDIIVLALPSTAVPDTILAFAEVWRAGGDKWLISASKGLNIHYGVTLEDVARKILGQELNFAVLSGPSFAIEVAKQEPTAIVLAAPQFADAQSLATLFHNNYLRVYPQNDVLGVQLGGSIKNILAFAVGVAAGLGFGRNTQAALLTRGLAEMMRFATALGADAHTLTGLAGVGDLVLTATDNQSRNRRCGYLLGQGLDQAAAVASIQQVVECIDTVQHVHSLAHSKDISMPITEVVYRIIYQNLPVRTALNELLARQAPSTEF